MGVNVFGALSQLWAPAMPKQERAGAVCNPVIGHRKSSVSLLGVCSFLKTRFVAILDGSVAPVYKRLGTVMRRAAGER